MKNCTETFFLALFSDNRDEGDSHNAPEPTGIDGEKTFSTFRPTVPINKDITASETITKSDLKEDE